MVLKNQKKHNMNLRIVHFLMKDGKKMKAQSILRKTFEVLKKSETSFQTAVENLKPFFEIKRIRVAGATREVPCLVPPQRQEGLALRWLLEAAKQRKRKNSKLPFENCLAEEILEASKGVGIARQKRDQLHRTAEANRAFVHYLFK